MKLITLLGKFDRFTRLLSGWFEWVGLAGLLLVMCVTCIDVIGAKVFLKPLFGAIDIVMLSQLVAISFAAAYAFILGRHVRVEFFIMRLGGRARAVIECAISLLGLVLFILIIWRLCVYGYSLKEGSEVSATALIPLYPFAYGAALACVPVCLVFLSRFLNALSGMVKR